MLAIESYWQAVIGADSSAAIRVKRNWRWGTLFGNIVVEANSNVG